MALPADEVVGDFLFCGTGWVLGWVLGWLLGWVLGWGVVSEICGK